MKPLEDDAIGIGVPGVDGDLGGFGGFTVGSKEASEVDVGDFEVAALEIDKLEFVGIDFGKEEGFAIWGGTSDTKFGEIFEFTNGGLEREEANPFDAGEEAGIDFGGRLPSVIAFFRNNKIM